MNIKFPEIPKPTNGRLGDILKPILQILYLIKPASIPLFMKLIEELNSDRSNERGSSIEAELLSKVQELASEVKNGKLAVKRIADKINMGRVHQHELSYPYIGRRLGAMGFKKASIGNGCAAVLWDIKLIEGLMNKYGVEKHHKDLNHHKRLKIGKTP
jgi:hypothetical protein